MISYFYAVTSIDVLNKLHEVGLLPEEERIKHVAAVRKLAVQTPDAGFLNRNIVSFLTNVEIEETLSEVREKLLPNIDVEIDVWKDNYSHEDSSSDYFEPLRGALSAFSAALAHDPAAVALIREGVAAVDKAAAEFDLRSSEDSDHGEYYRRESDGPSRADSRSIFDDVDE